MITVKMMQFTAMVLMLLLTLKLLLLHDFRIKTKEARRARWLMVGGMALLALHFFLQLKTGLRQMGVTQSVVLNLIMLMPVSYIIARALLMLQRRGKLSRADRWTGPLAWIVTMALLAVAAMTDGQPLFSDTPQLRTAEKIGAVLYMLMQGYYTWRHTQSLITMHKVLNNYYDRDTDGMLRWMQLGIAGMMLLALLVPMAIFGSGPMLLIFAFIIFFSIFYLVDSFCLYLVSPAPERMQAAEQNNDEMEQEISNEAINLLSHGDGLSTTSAILSPEMARAVDQAVEVWVAKGGYRKTGLLQPLAAADIGVSRYRLTCWLHQRGMKYTDWIASLRIEEAKRTIKAHPEWSNDAVAQHCGFSDRTVLQRTFKKLTGTTPQKYLEACSNH